MQQLHLLGDADQTGVEVAVVLVPHPPTVEDHEAKRSAATPATLVVVVHAAIVTDQAVTLVTRH
jgi:hypothetical protein